MKIRNIAIIAHVDHGKTTLVDALLRQSRTHLAKGLAGTDCIMDSDDLERERGITIFSKNASVLWKGVKINIIDTPGHADFGGEVERVLTMADGSLLLIDAQEGPMPQTRFVLRRALALGHRVIVVINKIDKQAADPVSALNRTFDLFIELGATEHQAEFPVIYAAGRDGKAGLDPDLARMRNIGPLFDAIVHHIPAPKGSSREPFQMRISAVTGDPYKGRIGIGRVSRGTLHAGDEFALIKRDGTLSRHRLLALMTFSGLTRADTKRVQAGDIAAIAGAEDINIGETVTHPETPEPLPLLEIEQPTVKTIFIVNDSPFAGREGQFTTSRQIRERLFRELDTDMALRVEDGPEGSWIVCGRGELHLAILIERMRREGYEFQVSRPEVITRLENGVLMTPHETVAVEVPEQYYGGILSALGSRQAQLQNMRKDRGTVFLEFIAPTRALFGFRSQFMIETRGEGILTTAFLEYRPDPGKWEERDRGSLVANETGETVLYGLVKAQSRGVLFVHPGLPVYKGQVVGENSRSQDIHVNVCREKAQTNMRSKGEGVAAHFNAPRTMALENALEYIGDDELVEVTPASIRIRKQILDENEYRRRIVHGIVSS